MFGKYTDKIMALDAKMRWLRYCKAVFESVNNFDAVSLTWAEMDKVEKEVYRLIELWKTESNDSIGDIND